MKVGVLLADGFEEIEAITIVDILRRAQIDTTTIFTGTNPVKGSHNIEVIADRFIGDVEPSEFTFIAIPGGMPGSKNLKEDDRVISLIKNIYSSGGYISAICAAPIVLGKAGILKGKKSTCYPGFEGELHGAEYISEPVIADGRVITGKGAGCAIPFSLKLVEIISGKDAVKELKERMQVYWM